MCQAISQKLNFLICSIYEAAFEETPWLVFLTQLNAILDAEVSSLVVDLDDKSHTPHLVKHILTKKRSSAQISEQWLSADPFKNTAANEASVFDYRAVKEDHINSSSRTFFESLELGQILGIDMLLASNVKLKIRVARKVEQTDFSRKEAEMISSLSVHFSLAAKFLDEIATKQIERNAFADAMNQLMLGVLILDVHGQVVASNRVAREIIQNFDELAINHGVLEIKKTKLNKVLYGALKNIEDSTKHDAMYCTLTIESGQSSPIGLRIRPVRPEDAIANPLHSHAVVFLSDSKQAQQISSDTLRDLFGFTGGEVRVAIHLANGFSIDETAKALGITKNTTKSHVKSIYEKTGVNKQIKLIQLIARSVASVSS
jgi:DNA-binding CsgD family transcriptional regulator